MRKQGAFLLPYIVLLAISLYALFSFEKLELHALMNQWQNSRLDLPFWIITNIGDGVTIAILCVIIAFYRVRFGLILGLISGLDGIVVQLLKKGPFAHLNRPAYFLDQMPDLQIMEGLYMNQNFSFPSGHTSAAFAFYFGLSLMVKNPWLKFACFLMASLIGYSRIFLSQHFLMDAVAGSLIGILIAYLVWILFKKTGPVQWMDRGVMRD